MSHTAASLPARSAESWGMPSVRLIKHEAVPHCGSFEIRFPDDRPSKYVYWDDLPGRRLQRRFASRALVCCWV